MLKFLKNNKLVQIGLFIVLIPLLCFGFSELLTFLLKAGRIVGTFIHNINY